MGPVFAVDRRRKFRVRIVGRRFALLALLFVLFAGPALAAQGFVPGIDDLPLMPGLAAEPGAVVFDKPTGRIVEASALGPDLSAGAVRDFYRRTLAALGWQRTGTLVFVREGERLKLVIEPTDTAGVRVRFDVAPR